MNWSNLLELAMPVISYIAAYLIHRPKKAMPPPLPPSMKQR